MSTRTLEPAAQDFANATAKPPLLYELGVEGARKLLDDVQAAPIDKLDVDETWITVAASVGSVQVRVLKPNDADEMIPTILYMHGGGWILGNAGTHDRLVRELCVGTGAAVVFVEYDRSPEARYPVAIEQAYATARWIVAEGSSMGLDSTRLAVAGDSVGGNMATALAILAKQSGDVTFVHQSLYYPVTDAAQNTASYEEFADGPHLTAKAMAWFWDSVTARRRRTSRHHHVAASSHCRRPRRTARHVSHRRRARRAPGRRRGVRTPAHRSRRAHDQCSLQRHDPRLPDAQPAPARRPHRRLRSNRQSTCSARRCRATDRTRPRPNHQQKAEHHVTSTAHHRPRPRWFKSSSWNQVIDRLYHHGAVLVGAHNQRFRDVVAIANPLRSLAGDAAYVRDVLNSIEGRIVLVGHSYGGSVITEAAAGCDAVVGLVYVAAFAPETGESALQLSTMFPGSTLGDALDAYPPVATGGNKSRSGRTSSTTSSRRT